VRYILFGVFFWFTSGGAFALWLGGVGLVFAIALALVGVFHKTTTEELRPAARTDEEDDGDGDDGQQGHATPPQQPKSAEEWLSHWRNGGGNDTSPLKTMGKVAAWLVRIIFVMITVLTFRGALPTEEDPSWSGLIIWFLVFGSITAVTVISMMGAWGQVGDFFGKWLAKFLHFIFVDGVWAALCFLGRKFVEFIGWVTITLLGLCVLGLFLGKALENTGLGGLLIPVGGFGIPVLYIFYVGGSLCGIALVIYWLFAGARKTEKVFL
jgi:hypothetical protein